MKNIKRLAATAATAAVMAFGLTVPAAADATSTNTCNSNKDSSTSCSSSSTDNSTTYTVNGDCSGIINNSVDQSQENSTDQDNVSAGGVIGSNNSSNSNSNSTSQSQSAGVNFAPNCSTTNVTQQVAAAAAAKPQVVAPKGGVHAGAGGSLAGTSNVPSIVGLAGSVGTAGIGLALRRKAQLEV